MLDSEPISVGRDGASDAICFINAGVPAVEFGPIGAGHHGPEEWVSIASLDQLPPALVDFVRLIPKRLSGRAAPPHRLIEALPLSSGPW